MTTLVKTQCPQCLTIHNVPRIKLSQSDVKARCDRCQQVFLINDNLASAQDILVEDQSTNINIDHKISKSSLESSKKNIPHKALPKNIESDDNILIHDDMEIDEVAEPITEYDSIDEMNAWLSQPDDSLSSNPNYQNNIPTDQSISSSHDTPSDSTQKHSTIAAGTSTASDTPLLSTTKAHQKKLTGLHKKSSDDSSSNPIPTANTAVTDSENTGNTWLESLLENESSVEPHIEPERDNTDLSELLTTIGMQADDQDRIDEERNNRIKARMQQPSIRYQNFIAATLWLAGCSVLVLLLLAQYVIFNLNTLVKNPVHAARLQTICSIAACSLPYADITALSMTKPTYSASRIKPANIYSDIEADLINQSVQMQLLPNLKVSLYDTDNLIMGEFIAAPEDYVLGPQQQIAANSKHSVMFTIAVPVQQISQVTIEAIY